MMVFLISERRTIIAPMELKLKFSQIESRIAELAAFGCFSFLQDDEDNYMY